MGKVTDDFNGAVLAVYDRERTICDCFKYRTKLDNEIFNKAVTHTQPIKINCRKRKNSSESSISATPPAKLSVSDVGIWPGAAKKLPYPFHPQGTAAPLKILF